MTVLRYITSGESHGKAIIGILEGIPSGISVSEADVDTELKRRQGGYGRGGRMKIESDHAEILSGIRWGKTIGSPISILVENKDWINWRDGMSHLIKYKDSIKAVTRPRPGHADLPGTIKYDHLDIRNVLERSSARETVMRVALGAIAKGFLSEFDIKIGSYVLQVGNQKMKFKSQTVKEKELLENFKKAEKSPVRCPEEETSKKIG